MEVAEIVKVQCTFALPFLSLKGVSSKSYPIWDLGEVLHVVLFKQWVLYYHNMDFTGPCLQGGIVYNMITVPKETI